MNSKETDMLDELLDVEDGLSDWEVDFVESLSNWRGDLTTKQAQTLEKIWNEHF